MPITVQLVVSNPTPAHGETVTASYMVAGNDGTPPEPGTLVGHAVIGGVDYAVEGTITKPAIAPLEESFSAPTMAGLAFQPTSDPTVWVALVP